MIYLLIFQLAEIYCVFVFADIIQRIKKEKEDYLKVPISEQSALDLSDDCYNVNSVEFCEISSSN